MGNILTPAGIQPESKKIDKFLSKMKMPQTVKQVKRLIGFVQFFRNHIPKLNEILIPFYELLQKSAFFSTNDRHREALEQIRNALRKAKTVVLRFPKPGLQYVICDASYHGAGCVLLVEDYLTDDKHKKQKTYAPVSFGSKLFNKAQLKLSIFCKEFLALYFALEEFSHFIWGVEKQVLVFSDIKNLTQFFKARTLHPSLWGYLDRVLAYNIALAHIPGKANVAADYISRIQTDPDNAIELAMSDSIPVREVKISLSAKTPDVALSAITECENMFEKSEDQVFDTELTDKLKKEGIYDAMLSQLKNQGISINSTEPRSDIMKIQFKPEMNALELQNPLDSFPDIAKLSNPFSLVEEQQEEKDIVKVIGWLSKNEVDNSRYLSFELRKYRKQFPRLIVWNQLLYRKFFDDTRKISVYQVCVSKHLRKEILYRLHNSKLSGQIGITRTVAEFRNRFYFPGFTEYLIDYIRNCLTCWQLKTAKNVTLRPPLQPVSSEQHYPGDVMQIDIIGPFDSNQYRFALTAVDVFSKYIFAIPLSKTDRPTVSKSLVSIFFRYSYIPYMIIADLGSVFTSDLMHELASLLEIKLRHATLKHAQSVGVVERSHLSMKGIVRLASNQTGSDWHKWLDIAVFIHNTSYSSAIGCSPTLVFHGREPHKPLDVRFNIKAIQAAMPSSDFLVTLQDAMTQQFSRVKEKLVTMYHKYRSYYDDKAEAKPLELFSYCLLLNPRLVNQSDLSHKAVQIWLPLYRVEKVLTNSNYLIRKVGTPFTQCVHRIRLRPIVPQTRIDDIDTLTTKFVADPSLSKFRQEPELFDEKIGKLFEEEYYEDRTTSSNKNGLNNPSAQVYWSYPIGHLPPALPNGPETPPIAPSPPNIFEPPEVQSDEEPVLFVDDPAPAEPFEDLSDANRSIDESEEPLITIQGHNNEQDQIESPRTTKSRIPIRDANWSRGPDSPVSTTPTPSPVASNLRRSSRIPKMPIRIYTEPKISKE